jgi:uncharacterized phage infection (PIP) family protein YhgE
MSTSGTPSTPDAVNKDVANVQTDIVRLQQKAAEIAPGLAVWQVMSQLSHMAVSIQDLLSKLTPLLDQLQKDTEKLTEDLNNLPTPASDDQVGIQKKQQMASAIQTQISIFQQATQQTSGGTIDPLMTQVNAVWSLLTGIQQAFASIRV